MADESGAVPDVPATPLSICMVGSPGVGAVASGGRGCDTSVAAG